MHVFVCVFLTNHQWSKKDNTTEWYHHSKMLSNQSIKIRIWFINCRINCYINANTLLLLRRLVHSLIVFLSICSTYLFNNCTSHLLFYLLDIAFFFSNCTSISSLQFEKHSKIHAFASQINAFSSSSFEKVIRFVRQHHLIYLFDNFLQQLFEHHLHYSSKYLTTIYTFTRQIDAFSSLLFRRLLNSISIRSSWNLLFLRSLLVDISTVTLLSTFHILLRFRFLLRWSRCSLMMSD